MSLGKGIKEQMADIYSNTVWVWKNEDKKFKNVSNKHKQESNFKKWYFLRIPLNAILI